ncbi:MAG: M28 family metallopeptidase, partial [Bacillota bacterium]
PDGFLQSMNVTAARLAGRVGLRIGSLELRHRRDFGEMPALSARGHVAGPLVPLRDGEGVPLDRLKGSVALVTRRPEGFDLAETAAAAADAGVRALVVPWGEPRWFHKTVHGAGGRIPVIRLRDALARRLARRGGLAARVDLPLDVGSKACSNVLGLRPGRVGAPALLLTAHYDHVGDDPHGYRFPGAEDNASGVAAVLAAARTLGRREPLPFPVLVGFLTGEESGSWGARHLAAHSPLPLGAVINVDVVGVEAKLTAMRLGHSTPGDWLAGLAAEVLERRNVGPRWIRGQDDSAAFIAAGLPTVGLGQQSVAGGGGKLHTPDDTADRLSLMAVREAAEVVVAMVDRLALDPSLLQLSRRREEIWNV